MSKETFARLALLTLVRDFPEEPILLVVGVATDVTVTVTGAVLEAVVRTDVVTDDCNTAEAGEP